MYPLASQVEYDMDEEDHAWLALFNDGRDAVSQDTFELVMDRFEKEVRLFISHLPFSPQQVFSLFLPPQSYSTISTSP